MPAPYGGISNQARFGSSSFLCSAESGNALTFTPVRHAARPSSGRTKAFPGRSPLPLATSGIQHSANDHCRRHATRGSPCRPTHRQCASQARVIPNCYCSPNRCHFGREACSTRCSGVRPKTACSPATRWLSFSRPPLRLPQLPRAIFKVPTALCRVVTLGSRSSAEAAQRSAPMSFSRANAWASSAPSYISHAIFLIHRPPARLPT